MTKDKDNPHPTQGKEEIPDCWDFMNCGEAAYSDCPAYPDKGMDCWKITGTKCAGGMIAKASLTDKIIYCRNHCRYYKTYMKKFFP